MLKYESAKTIIGSKTKVMFSFGSISLRLNAYPLQAYDQLLGGYCSSVNIATALLDAGCGLEDKYYGLFVSKDIYFV